MGRQDAGKRRSAIGRRDRTTQAMARQGPGKSVPRYARSPLHGTVPSLGERTSQLEVIKFQRACGRGLDGRLAQRANDDWLPRAVATFLGMVVGASGCGSRRAGQLLLRERPIPFKD